MISRITKHQHVEFTNGVRYVTTEIIVVVGKIVYPSSIIILLLYLHLKLCVIYNIVITRTNINLHFINSIL